jgi:hypothetical protein
LKAFPILILGSIREILLSLVAGEIEVLWVAENAWQPEKQSPE